MRLNTYVSFAMIFSLVLFGCTNSRNKDQLVVATKIHSCGNLYVNVYRVSTNGAVGGDLLAYYITDSLQFRKFLGVCDDHEAYSYECNGNTVCARRVFTAGYPDGSVISKVQDSLILDITALKAKGKFD